MTGLAARRRSGNSVTPRPSSRACGIGDVVAGAKAAAAGCRRSQSVQSRSCTKELAATETVVPTPPSARGSAPNARRPVAAGSRTQASAEGCDSAVAGSLVPVPPGGPTPPPGRGPRGRRPQPKFVASGDAEAVAQMPNLRQMFMSSQLVEAPKAAPCMTPRTTTQRAATPQAVIPQTPRDNPPVTPRKLVDLQTESSTDDRRCSVALDTAQSTEIRTKVFRMGAPLLRSTIPVQLGTPRQAEARALAASPSTGCDDGSDTGSDAETILSLSEVGIDDIGSLSVTFDFPC